MAFPNLTNESISTRVTVLETKLDIMSDQLEEIISKLSRISDEMVSIQGEKEAINHIKDTVFKLVALCASFGAGGLVLKLFGSN